MSKKKENKKDKKEKIITIDMPLAIPMMILNGCKELNLDAKKEINERLHILYSPIEPEYGKDYWSQALYRNYKFKFKKDVNIDELFEEIYIKRNDFNFEALLKYFACFYGYNEISEIKNADDIKEIYNFFINHNTKVTGTVFDKDYCWAIAKTFLENKITLPNSIPTFNNVEDTYPIRKELVKCASDDLYIAGTTLKDAFSTSADNSNVAFIKELFANSKIKNVTIFILNYQYLGISEESASKEIELSINNLMYEILGCTEYCPNIDLILLSDYDIAFSLMTNSSLLTRSTHLFDYKRQYKGQYLLFDSESDEYCSLKKYFDFLKINAYELDISTDSSLNSLYSVKNTYRANRGAYESKGFKIKKIHPTQLENLVKASFHTVQNTLKNENIIEEKLDDTQKLLLGYIKETENLLSTLVCMHDPNGRAKIIPCNDLGFPNNVTRIAGGFLTGAYYDWSCAVPIIPVDATVNTCTSSVFKINGFSREEYDDQSFENIMNKLYTNAIDKGYAFSFDSGNHFLTIANDNDDNYYFIIHCSAKHAKESCFGLYPSDRVWYKDKIKTLYNKEQTRYIRYIRGDAAVKFIDYADRFRNFNVELHKFIATELAKIMGLELSDTPIIRHHYGMPTSSSIAIGTFVVDVLANDEFDLKVPIFSDFGKDMCLYRVDREQKSTYTPAGTNKKIILVPHGWGQTIENFKKMRLENIKNEKKRILNIEADNVYPFKVDSKNRITNDPKKIRDFENIESFIEGKCSNIVGKIEKIYHPILCYRTHPKDNLYFMDENKNIN